jgi:NAD+ diphosphatase
VTRRFVPAIEANGPRTERAWWFAFSGDELLVLDGGVPCVAELAETGVDAGPGHYLGRLAELDCFAVGLDPQTAVPPGGALEGLRRLFGRLDEDLYALAGRAFQVIEWDRSHRFCGRCGSPTEDVVGERAKRCSACEHLAFPRLSPAVIVLVSRGRDMLLARNRSFPLPIYSALAGFVDPGESLEEAVRREVREEVGVEIDNIHYFGSQPWPYPHSLMIGFTARYAGGEIVIDESELVDAAWFSAARLPELPGKLSIARSLIDSFLAANR